MGIPFPEEYGGGGRRLARLRAGRRGAGAGRLVGGDHPVRAHVARDAAAVPVRQRGAEAASWLPRAVPRARSSAAFGLTEPEAGSDAGNTQTRAALEDGEWVINGAKQFITNAGTDISGVVVITAVTGRRRRPPRDLQPAGRERHARLRAGAAVPQDGLERLRHPAAVASPTAGCPRRTSSAIAAPGCSQFLHVLDIGRIGVAAMGVGLAQGALDQALAYARERRAFGQPISASRRSRPSSPTSPPRSRRPA